MYRLLIILILLITCNFAVAQDERGMVVEEVLAVVGHTPILASDMALARIVRLAEPLAGEEPSAYSSRLLEVRINLELQFRDLEASGVIHRLDLDPSSALSRLSDRYGDRAELASRLAEHGLALSDVEELSLRLAVTAAYVEQRLRPRVAVSLEEVEAAYHGELSAGLAAVGEELPELATVSEQIHRLLVERKLTDEIERWLDEARERQELTRFVR